MPSLSTKSSDDNYASLIDKHTKEIQSLKSLSTSQSQLINQLKSQTQSLSSQLSLLRHQSQSLQKDRDLYLRALQAQPLQPGFLKAVKVFEEFEDDTISDSNPGEDVTKDEN